VIYLSGLSRIDHMTWIARFFSDGDLTGRVLEITSEGMANGFQDLNDIGFNNEFSSAEVKPGYRARAFTDLNFSGQQLRLDKDPQFGRADFIPGPDGVMRFTFFPNAPDFRFNDNISSIYSSIYCEAARTLDATNPASELEIQADREIPLSIKGALFDLGLRLAADNLNEIANFQCAAALVGVLNTYDQCVDRGGTLNGCALNAARFIKDNLCSTYCSTICELVSLDCESSGNNDCI